MYSVKNEVRCYPITYASKNSGYKTCRGTKVYSGLTFEQSLRHPNAHEQWLRYEKNVVARRQYGLGERKKEVYAGFRTMQAYKRRLAILRMWIKNRQAADRAVAKARRVLGYGRKHWRITQKRVPAAMRVLMAAKRAILKAHRGKHLNLVKQNKVIRGLHARHNAARKFRGVRARQEAAALSRKLVAQKQMELARRVRVAARRNRDAHAKQAKAAHAAAKRVYNKLAKSKGMTHDDRKTMYKKNHK